MLTSTGLVVKISNDKYPETGESGDTYNVEMDQANSSSFDSCDPQLYDWYVHRLPGLCSDTVFFSPGSNLLDRGRVQFRQLDK